MLSRNVIFAVALLMVSIAQSESFVIHKGNRASYTTKLNLFGGLKDAFANDDGLGKAQNAGLTNGPKVNEKVTMNGKAVKAVVGQKVSVVANAARVRIKYDCRNGDCGTCMIKMNGKKVKACQQVIPSGPCAIDTLS